MITRHVNSPVPVPGWPPGGSMTLWHLANKKKSSASSSFSEALSQKEHFLCTCGLTNLQWPPCARVCKSTRPYSVPFLILAFRRVLASAPFVAVMRPQFALLPSLHWGELLPDSQSGITSRKCGLGGRPWGFRVPFGTGPEKSKVLLFFIYLFNCFAITTGEIKVQYDNSLKIHASINQYNFTKEKHFFSSQINLLRQ